jgi:hypothetical protein
MNTPNIAANNSLKKVIQCIFIYVACKQSKLQMLKT